MRRRRRYGGEPLAPLNPFLQAHESIHAKEQDVYRATINAQFDMDDVARWLFPEDTIAKLKAAYPLAESSYHKNFVLSGWPLSSGDKVLMSLDFDSIKMQCPLGAVSVTPNAQIMDLLVSIYELHKQFNKVRKVIDWFGEHKVTPGAAVYYWPTIRSLCGSGHAVHDVTGDRYRVVTGISEIIPLLRETAGIIAGAALCPRVPSHGSGAAFNLTCVDNYARSFMVL